jgi:spermidine dehydrogenase
MLSLSFRDYENIIVDVIDHTVNRSGGDFEPERDIESIMLNRWNYGYAYELCSTFDPSIFGPVSGQPQFRARRPFANVAIANSDSGAFAYTHSAINEAYRAVQDLPDR